VKSETEEIDPQIRDRSPSTSGATLALRAALIEAATRLMDEPEAWRHSGK
jgi:hypothetical protein